MITLLFLLVLYLIGGAKTFTLIGHRSRLSSMIGINAGLTQIRLKTDEAQDTSEMFYAKVSEKERNLDTVNLVEVDIEKTINYDDTSSKTSHVLESPDENFLPYTSELQELISSPQLEILDSFLVLLSSFTVALSTLPKESLPAPSFILLDYLETGLGVFFFSAFFIRWYSVGQLKITYLLRPLAFIDVFASVLPVVLSNVSFLGVGYIPAVLSSPSALANLRLLRILRLQALLVDMKTFSKVQIAFGIETEVKKYQLTLARVVITILCLVSVATGCIYAAEHEVNPQIPDYFTALYFGLTTLTTVGFGDITPITTEGRFVVIASILVGVVVIPVSKNVFNYLPQKVTKILNVTSLIVLWMVA